MVPFCIPRWRHPVASCAIFLAVTAASTTANAQNVHVADDTNINLLTPGQVNGAATSNFVRNIGAGGERHAFLRFDLSTLPSGVAVNKAALRVYVNTVNAGGSVDVHQVVDAWSEATLSALNSPALGALAASFDVAASDQDQFVTVDVTNVVRGWLEGSVPNHGIALVPSVTNPIRMAFDSKEATAKQRVVRSADRSGGLCAR